MIYYFPLGYISFKFASLEEPTEVSEGFFFEKLQQERLLLLIY
jgi:hypothetical protein